MSSVPSTTLSLWSAGVVCAGVAWTVLKDLLAARKARRLAVDESTTARALEKERDTALTRVIEEMGHQFTRLSETVDKHDRSCIEWKSTFAEMARAMKLTLDRHERQLEGHTSQIRAGMTGAGSKRITIEDEP